MNPIQTISPRIAVIICTRHRPPGLSAALRHCLAGTRSPEWLIVVDQADPQSHDPLTEFEDLAGFVRISIPFTGLSRARNVGMAAAEARGAHLVAFTDDDCLPATTWLEAFVKVFADSPSLALVYGSTRAVAYDRARGVIPAYIVERPSVHRGIRSKSLIEGMGACMAIQVAAWKQVGGFDDWLGAGTALASGDETDFCIRILLAGWSVALTPWAEVSHLGFRESSSTPSLIAGYMRGSGAATAKMLRLGGGPAWVPLARTAWRWLCGRSPIELGQNYSRLARLRSFLAGVKIGLTTPIERESGRFLPWVGPDDLTASAKAAASPSHPARPAATT